MARPPVSRTLGPLEASTRQIYEAVRRLVRVAPDLHGPDGALRAWDELAPWSRRLLTSGYAGLTFAAAMAERLCREERAFEEAQAVVEEWLAEPAADATQSCDTLARRIALRLLERDETIVELVRVGMAGEG